MSVKKEPSGRRSVQAEIEVPGTPEQVWQAIATGPGVSSWFVPTEVAEVGADGLPTKIRSHFGPGMDAVARVTAWDPPHRFSGESLGLGPNAPALATEWILEARAGGTCVVRVVHSLFASTDDWDNQLESIEHGWPKFFHILRLYLTHFPGLPVSPFQLFAMAPAPESAAWDALTDALGLAGATKGERRRTRDRAPAFAGLVEAVGTGEERGLLLRLDEPTPGLLHLFAHTMGGQVFLMAGVYLYGDGAAAAAARDEPAWQAWLHERFAPISDSAGAAAC